jgi:hypothetical protein
MHRAPRSGPGLSAKPLIPRKEENRILLKITGEKFILVSRNGDFVRPFDLALRGGDGIRKRRIFHAGI